MASLGTSASRPLTRLPPMCQPGLPSHVKFHILYLLREKLLVSSLRQLLLKLSSSQVVKLRAPSFSLAIDQRLASAPGQSTAHNMATDFHHVEQGRMSQSVLAGQELGTFCNPILEVTS